MGGNALKMRTRRVGVKEYEEIKKELISFFLREGYNDVRSIPHIANKESFGDLDLLVNKPKLDNLEEVLRKLGTKEIYHNGSVVSFEYKEFQVDLIHCAPENLDIANVYFAYNDTGMLLGMLARRTNCKYSSEGLLYLYFTGAKKWEIFLTRDPRKIFNFLGVDYDRFLEGFRTLDEVVDFIRKSHLFDSEAFISLEEWNHYKRKRNSKRPNWQYVLRTLKEKPKISNPKPDDPKSYVDQQFPEAGLKSEILQIKHWEERQRKVKEKFNGERVRTLTGYEGKELGKFISMFKSEFKDFERFILNNSQNIIDQEIQRFLWQITN